VLAMDLMKPSVFKVKQSDGGSIPYCSDANSILKQAFAAGLPSVRFSVQGKAYKFDFKRMEQRDLMTGEVLQIIKPLGLTAPPKPLIPQLGARPAFVVRVPAEHGPGKMLRVPHPKKLGKAMRVAVPAGAKAGQLMFVPICTKWKKRASYISCGAATGAAITAGVLMNDAVLGAAGAATAALVSTAGGAAPFVLGGLAVAGAVAAVHVARQHPFKFAAVGATVVGGLAAADYVADHGVLDAAGDLAEGARDAVEGVGDAAWDAAEAGWEAGEEAVEFAQDFCEHWLDSDLEQGITDIISSLF